MLQIYTTNDLIRFIYQETSEAENAGIAAQLRNDGSFATAYESLLATIHELDGLAESPDPTSVQLIMEHAHTHHESVHEGG